MLGLAMKAGKVVSGEFAVDKSIKEGSAFLVIIASDASDNTRKKFSNSCELGSGGFGLWGDGRCGCRLGRSGVNLPSAVRGFVCNFPSSARSLCVNFSLAARSFGYNFSSTARSCRLA